MSKEVAPVKVIEICIECGQQLIRPLRRNDADPVCDGCSASLAPSPPSALERTLEAQRGR